MADVQILASGTLAAPLDYVIPGAQEILIKAMAATFNGAGAGTTWQPAITLLAPGGKEVGTFPVGSALAAGASADVAWFPRGGVNAAAVVSGDLHWGVNTDVANVGLELDSVGNALVSNFGATTFETNGAGFLVLAQGGGIDLDTGGGGITADLHGGGFLFNTAASVDVQLDVAPVGFRVLDPLTGNQTLQVSNDGAAATVGFFNTGPVAQQGTPVTLANVIALLRAYGLAA